MEKPTFRQSANDARLSAYIRAIPFLNLVPNNYDVVGSLVQDNRCFRGFGIDQSHPCKFCLLYGLLDIPLAVQYTFNVISKTTM